MEKLQCQPTVETDFSRRFVPDRL